MKTSVAAASYRLVVLMLAGCLIVGCSGSSGDAPKTVPVTGKVTYKGSGVDGAHVTFLGDGKIHSAQAKTNKSGDFILTTSSPGDGAVPGTHQVIITKIVGSPSAAPAAVATGPASMEAAAKAAQEKKTESESSELHLLPEKYSKANTSGLSFTVEEGKKNHFEIPLVD